MMLMWTWICRILSKSKKKRFMKNWINDLKEQENYRNIGHQHRTTPQCIKYRFNLNPDTVPDIVAVSVFPVFSPFSFHINSESVAAAPRLHRI